MLNTFYVFRSQFLGPEIYSGSEANSIQLESAMADVFWPVHQDFFTGCKGSKCRRGRNENAYRSELRKSRWFGFLSFVQDFTSTPQELVFLDLGFSFLPNFVSVWLPSVV